MIKMMTKKDFAIGFFIELVVSSLLLFIIQYVIVSGFNKQSMNIFFVFVFAKSVWLYFNYKFYCEKTQDD